MLGRLKILLIFTGRNKILSDSYDDKIKDIKGKIEKAKAMRYKAEVRIEHLTKEKEDLLKKMDEYGVKPEDLEAEIVKLKEEIDNLINEADNLIPKDILNNN
jgi:peptidoglycan hydrolase CwlO-like protein